MTTTRRRIRQPRPDPDPSDADVVRTQFWRGLTHGLTVTRATLAAALGGILALAIVGVLVV